MLIKKYKHKNISNNIQIQQPSSPSSGDATPATDGSCNNSADLRHLLRQLDVSCYPLEQHQPRTRTRTHRMWCLSSVLAVVLGVILLPLPPQCGAVGYSYTRFRGPVSGPEHRIYVRNGNGAATGKRGGAQDDHDEAARLDYVAKPEYEFAYGVEDAQAHILHNRNEMRDGDVVKGVYSVVDPDGTLRVVRYTADDINGFQAEVIKNGISAIHGQLQQDTPTVISHQNSNHNNNNDYNDYQQPANLYSPGNNNNNHQHHPSYYYPTPAHQGNPPTNAHNYNNHPNNYNTNPNSNGGAGDNANNANNDYDDNQDYNNEDDYRPQYEVHEEPNNEEDDKEDVEDQYEGQDNNNKKVTGGDKKKDYDDDGDGDDDGDEEDDDYDDSDELEDYDEAVKANEASDESDEYY